MAEMTKKERVRSALEGRPVDRVPVSVWGHDFEREWRPQDLVAATLDSYRAYGWDFIKFNPRATYFAEAWGNRYVPMAGRQPRLEAPTVTAADQFSGICPVDGRSGVFGDHLYALRLLSDEVAGEVDVVQTVFSPLAVAAQLCGVGDEFARYAAEDPAGAHRAVAAIAATLTEYAKASLECGVSGIFFAPLTWASRDTASENFYREFGRPYDLQVLTAASGAQFNILHVCRNHNMLDLLLDYPVRAFNWADHGEGNPSLAEIKARTPAAVMGGLDHAHLHEMAPEEATAQANDAIAAVPAGLFLTGGCAIRPETPPAVLAAIAPSDRG